jgi:hypothetical protein
MYLVTHWGFEAVSVRYILSDNFLGSHHLGWSRRDHYHCDNLSYDALLQSMQP